MISTANRACPVCDGRKVEALVRQRFVLEDGHPLRDGYSVVHCMRCGFVYADVAATQADYDAYYAELSKYDDPATSTGSGDSPLDRERLAGTAEILDGILGSREARVLDIGCASGGLLHALRHKSYPNLVGVDPSAACVRQAREKIGEAHQAWISNLPETIGTFDCVVLSHVMEHVLEVQDALKALRPVLREGGRVYIEVPDAARYADHIYAPFQDFNTEHINHFSLKSLENAMKARGFVSTSEGRRLLRSSSYTFTPAVYRIFEASGTALPEANAAPPELDTSLKPAVLRYIERSAELLRAIDERIGAELAEGEEVIVWGAGQLTMKLLVDTCLSRAKIAAFVDSNPVHQGKRLASAPILAPSAIAGCYPQPILIGTLLHHRAILEQIGKLGLENRTILLPEGGPKFFGERVQ